MHTALFAIMLSIAAGGGGQNARGSHWSACQMTHRVQEFDRLQDMPVIVQTEVRRLVGTIAEPGEPFNPTDVIGEGAPQHRFIRGVRSNRRWFVWYEHGGIGHHRHVLEIGIGLSGIPPHQRPAAAVSANLTGDPCRVTDALLDGVHVGAEY